MHRHDQFTGIKEILLIETDAFGNFIVLWKQIQNLNVELQPKESRDRGKEQQTQKIFMETGHTRNRNYLPRAGEYSAPHDISAKISPRVSSFGKRMPIFALSKFVNRLTSIPSPECN